MGQGGFWRGLTSWALFLLLAIIIPIISHFVLSYAPTHRAFDSVAELSLTGADALSYYTLARFLRLYGLRRFLTLDKVHSERSRSASATPSEPILPSPLLLGHALLFARRRST
ncbi:hypothetical protein J5N97_010103 [Dioscorea zingiberensis]|uniref:Uncharacterized protein n=1 Tax=Dioscorea zingiberensis TaxID=325984 RepID=A0A9D5D0N3_9LILI|nr:hypothetical protein J5N97_010103 [Dioscorea zingiberensis]